MRIRNLDKVRNLIRSKLPLYLEEVGCKIERSKVSCPNIEAHDHDDKGKLSAAFLPDSRNQLIYCFVENRTFDIFDVYALKTNQSISGRNFYTILKELAVKYNVEIEEEYEYSAKEKELYRQRLFIEKLHKLSYTKQQIKKGSKYLKNRNLSLEKVKEWKIGYLDPNDITPELNKECKNMFNYRLLSVFHTGGIIIPVFDEFNQYSGVLIRMCDTDDENPYIKVCITGSNLFNIERVRSQDELIIVEGIFDAIALYPAQNVVACLTNFVNDANLEKIAKMDIKKIKLALDPDNFYKGSVRDGFLRTILRMKNLDTDISIIKIPESEDLKLDPDEYMKNHTLDDFNNLVQISAINYLLENYRRGLIKADIIYDFIAGNPNLIRKEHYINECAKALEIGKRQLVKSIEDISDKKTSFNMIQFVQEKESYDELLEEFTESAWNKQYEGMSSGYPLFDKKFGGFEDTLYLLIGFPESGKSSYLLNFIYNLANRKDTFVAFYSLDDGAKRSVLPRLMSIASNLKSKEIRKPDKLFEKEWFHGMGKLKELKENLIIKDGAEVRTLDDLDNFIKIHSTIAEERNKKFIVVIDNLHDLQASKYKSLEATPNSQQIASYLKRLPQKMNCPIIATAEVPKSAGMKPSGKDIKESIDLWYAARFVGGIYSNFHYVKNKEESNLHWKDENNKYHPIMELFVSKNQTGEAEHGSLYYKFNFDNNTLTECNERETEILADGGFLTFMEE